MSDKIYIDIFFVTNFMADFLILYAVCAVLRLKGKLTRILLACLFGSLVSCALIFVPQALSSSIIFKVVFTLAFSLIAFGYKTFRSYIKKSLCLLFVGVIMNSVVGLLYQYTALGTVMTFTNGGIYINSSLMLLFGFLFLAYITVYAIIWVFSWYRRKDVLYRVEIQIDNKSVSAIGFLDTGNKLKCGVTRAPVIVAEYSAVKDLIPFDVRNCYKDGINSDNIELYFENSKFKNRLRLVPYASVDVGNILIGFSSDKVKVFEHNKINEMNDIVVAVTNKPLSDGKYTMLLPQQIFSEV